MDKIKRNALMLIALVIVLSAIGFLLHSMTTTVEFNEFSVDVAMGTSFITMPVENDPTIKEMYRANGEDLTITSFDKKYIEEAYYNQTGKHIDYSKGLMDNFTGSGEITKINKHITRSIITTDINGQTDTDVACLYIKGDHVIIVEGGDVDFITETAKSINIL